MTSKQMDAFKVNQESEAVREQYGKTGFGRGCLMARRLVEQGVPFVEVDLGGWDTHANNFNTLGDTKLPELDKAMSALVSDLDERGLLEDTAIIWMGEFGRTPRINGNSGRDHWARSWSVVLGGAGMKGGIAVGKHQRRRHRRRHRALHLARRDGHGLQVARHFAGNHLHQPQRPPDEDRQQRQGDQRAVRVDGLLKYCSRPLWGPRSSIAASKRSSRRPVYSGPTAHKVAPSNAVYSE